MADPRCDFCDRPAPVRTVLGDLGAVCGPCLRYLQAGPKQVSRSVAHRRTLVDEFTWREVREAVATSPGLPADVDPFDLRPVSRAGDG